MNKPFYQTFKKFYDSQYAPLQFSDGDYWFYLSICIIVLALVLFLIYIIYQEIYDKVDKSTATKNLLYGILIDKKYKGEESSSGVGTAIVPNTSGGIGIGIVSTHSDSPEEFLFFIKADKIYKCEVNMQVYYSKNIGENISFNVLIGGKSKKELSVNIY